ncbi:calcium/sodium antiporter [Ferrimonas sediminicola]|uniref:Calcium/sodium antiporter n=1 Tax=Ferrimonas sediminicola TaxID=2569538 RepID=A0A4U1BIG1_9GAMM|nr:calcium/sodium antiporter [Ferrimonas sediminicola]TKB51240.1 calcium/sodium antiporter [Ferrimonas sediminicola]
MLLNLLLLAGGLALLVWSADRFVYGAAAIARNLGLPSLIIGLTIVSMGSSAPEMMVSATAALEGRGDTAIGNVLGSNIANITLILGATALLRPLVVSSSTLKREMPLMMAGTLLAGYLLSDLDLSRTDGLLLAAAFVIILGYLCVQAWQNRDSDPLGRESDEEIPRDLSTPMALVWLVLGMALLPLASNWMVDGAVGIAQWFGMSDLVIGLTIIAIGTSLPELAACIAGVLKNEDDLAIGNVVGSNLFNILAVLAVPALLAPGPVDANAAGRDLYMMMATSLAPLLLLWMKKRQVLSRAEGLILLVVFIAYQGMLFTQAG